MHEIELIDGTIIKAKILVRTLFCAVLKMEDGSFKLLSKFACKDPDVVKFRTDSTD